MEARCFSILGDLDELRRSGEGGLRRSGNRSQNSFPGLVTSYTYLQFHVTVPKEAPITQRNTWTTHNPDDLTKEYTWEWLPESFCREHARLEEELLQAEAVSVLS